MNLGQVIPGRFALQRQFDVEVLSDGRVHDATCQDVRETAVITCAPVGRGGWYGQNEHCNKHHSNMSTVIYQNIEIHTV